jgi:hypothetical protein
MPWWPGWDSAETANWWAHFWFWFGIGCFVLLGASEIVAFRYVLRKDALIEIRDQQRDEQAKRDRYHAEIRREAEVGALQKQVADADKKVAELQKQKLGWRLTQEQKNTLIAAMRPFPWQKISITCIMGDLYGKETADDFIAVAKTSGWDTPPEADQTVYTIDPVGILLFVNEAEGQAGRFPVGLEAMARAMADVGLMTKLAVSGDAGVPIGTIQIVVGKKP